jgi:cellobiose phosphorylase
MAHCGLPWPSRRWGDGARAWELTTMLNPVNHARTPQGVARYKVEPYVVAADVYALAPHTGRGGWTWYTGSAGWMYRLILESIVGLTLEAGRLRFAPCLPPEWDKVALRYRHGETHYDIVVRHMETEGEMDGAIVVIDEWRGRAVSSISSTTATITASRCAVRATPNVPPSPWPDCGYVRIE